jgi:preprotein translocase subunit YajC
MSVPASLFSAPSTLAIVLAQAAAPTTAKPAPQSSFLDALPMLGFMVIIFYFLLIRPQQKRAKEQANLISAIKSGDRIITSGGLHGIVANARDASDKTVLVKFAENVKIEVEKANIAVVTKVSTEGETKAVAVKTGS